MDFTDIAFLKKHLVKIEELLEQILKALDQKSN